MSFWRRDDFKALNREWKKKLAESGFEDIEDEKENLSNKDHRTSAFSSHECTVEFYSALSSYLNTQREISERDRQILTMYSEGVYITGDTGIVVRTGWSARTIHKVIAHHKKLILKS